jgi:hypothetical protein
MASVSTICSSGLEIVSATRFGGTSVITAAEISAPARRAPPTERGSTTNPL